MTRACSRCGQQEASYPKPRPCWCADCQRAYQREYQRKRRGTTQRYCVICAVEVPPRHSYCCDDHRREGHRRNKRVWARRTRAAARRSTRIYEQLELPLAPILRLVLSQGYSINSLGPGRAKMIHRGQSTGTVPLWWADEVVVGLLGAPDVFNDLCAEVGA